jgi:predicted transcriptional regulator
MNKSLTEMAAGIIQSQCTANNMSAEEVTNALQMTFKALQALQADEAKTVADPQTSEEAGTTVDIDPKKSILKNKIICLECGESFKSLSPKHLRTHGLDGRSYRKKYGFPLRQALCAKAITERRSKAGKERGIPKNLQKAIDAKRKKKAAAAKK